MNRQAEQKLFSYIKSFVDNSARKLSPFITVGDLNKKYIRGEQHYKIDPTSQSITKKKYRPNVYKEKKVFNKMLPIFLTRQGILSDNRPIPGFKPDHNYAESMDASLVGNKFLREFSKESQAGKTYSQMIRHADNYALVWLKTGIDWSQGDKTYEAEMEVTNPRTGDKTTQDTTFYEGRPFVDVCSIHEVFPQTLRGDDMEDIPALVHRRALTVKHIRDKWGVTVDPEPVQFPDNAILKNDISAARQEDEYAYAYEYYENPSSKHPDGRYVVAVNNQILYDDILPYTNGPHGKRRIPFDYYNLQPLDGIIPGVTAYAQIIDAQDTYNSVRNRLLEYINHMAIGQMFEFSGSLVNPDQWTNTPGERILLKKHGRPPQPVRKERLGSELAGYTKSIEEDMLITAGLSQLTAFGASKSNMRSDGVVDKIAESDNNKLTVALQNASDTLIEVYKKIIYLEKQRQKILTEDLGLAERDDFVVKYTLDNVDPEELIIVNREFLMKSDAAIEKKVTQATNLGLYDPQMQMKYRTKLEFLETMNSGYLQDTLDPIERTNYNRIKREHAKLYAGKEIEVDEMEFHEMHVDEHTIELLSPELAQLEVTDNERFKVVTEALRKHIEEHQGYLKQTSMKQDYENAKAFQQ